MREHGAGDIDTSVAHNARVWNYWLGGKDNFAADRVVGDSVRTMFPLISDVARADRVFLGRAVRFLTGDGGIRQFLDIGTGLPTVANTHEVAREGAPSARVVYVDNDPLVLVHARALLSDASPEATAYIDADAHEPQEILRLAATTLDLEAPVAVMMLGVLNFVLDDGDAARVVSELMDAVPAGSYLALTHPTLELDGQANAEAMAFWNANATPPITARTRDQIAGWCAGLEILEPGIVPCSLWRPAPSDVGAPVPVPQWSVVARKP